MPSRFVSQPYSQDFDLLDFFEHLAADDQLTHLDVVVAWAKRSGIDAVQPSIEAFRARGGYLRIIVGISLGGTSRQALSLIKELADEAYVFHVPGRTFHPKVYFASGAEVATILVGSHNLTGGGAEWNFEAGVLAVLDLLAEPDRHFADAVAAYVSRLVADEEVCRRVDDDFLDQLNNSSRYVLADEARQESREDPVESGPPVAAGDASGLSDFELFGASRHKLRSRRGPRFLRQAASELAEPGTPSRVHVGVSGSATRDRVVKRWFKRLPAADAQQLAGSSPSNTMTLVQAGHHIDPSSYFRQEFFGDAHWVTAETRGAGQPREIASGEFEVRVRGMNLGTHAFDVRHTPGYEAAQSNRTTELAWRDFGGYLRRHDVTDLFGSLEKTATGIYRLVINEAPAGDFMY